MSRITITGGTACGRKISVVPQKVRPTPARLRRALFDILGDIENLHFIDLFAGSGAVGIEALSRSAKPVKFIEIEKMQCRAIAKNIASVGLADVEHKIICTDALRWLSKFEPDSDTIVFASPPYIEKFLPKILNAMCEFGSRFTSDNIVAVLQFPKRSLPAKYDEPPSRVHIVGDDALIFWAHTRSAITS